MIDRLHVDGYHLRLRRGAANADHVSGRHGDGIAVQKLCCTGIHHNDLRIMFLDRLRYLVIPDRIARDIQSRLALRC